MSARTAGKQETKAALLQTGMDIMMEKGYSNTGIQEILSTLNVPKGSFYHYFDSKESYAVEIIRYFDHDYSKMLNDILSDSKLSPLERLKAYCLNNKALLISHDCRRGCLIGNLSQEMADQSEVLRKELSSVVSKWRDSLAACICEGQKCGEIIDSYSADQLAELFSSGWSGAVMRAKTLKSPEPLDVFIELMFGYVLKA